MYDFASDSATIYYSHWWKPERAGRYDKNPDCKRLKLTDLLERIFTKWTDSNKILQYELRKNGTVLMGDEKWEISNVDYYKRKCFMSMTGNGKETQQTF